jgi:S-adenosylmethionine hydrolase
MIRTITYRSAMHFKALFFSAWLALLMPASSASDTGGLIVLQTDFGLKDQAVAAMRGVIRGVDRHIVIDDLTHEISAYNVWEAAYRLNAVIDYWPNDTVFVSVVDPGVGTERKSVVARLKTGHTIVTPDNGTLTLVADRVGLQAVRQIDEQAERLPGSQDSFTFFGRDVYAYVGAQIASDRLKFDAVGPALPDIVRLPYEKARQESDRLIGGIPVLDPQYGNLWTNIPAAALGSLGLKPGDRATLRISEEDKQRVSLELAYVRTFGDVAIGQPLLYVNSVGTLAVALNQGNFSTAYRVTSGPTWRVEITRVRAE